MIRRFVYSMLVVMALQLSWSVVAAYCMHETGRSANHLGHHAHNTSAEELSLVSKDPEPMSKKAATMHDAHCASIAHLALAAPETPAVPYVAHYLMRALDVTPVSPTSVVLSPPERPQWPGRA